MKKFITVIFLLFLTTCSQDKDIQEIQQKYKEIFAINPSLGDQYITLDSKGCIHLVTTFPKSDIIVFNFQDIEKNLNRDFTLEDIRRSSKNAKPYPKKLIR